MEELKARLRPIEKSGNEKEQYSWWYYLPVHPEEVAEEFELTDYGDDMEIEVFETNLPIDVEDIHYLSELNYYAKLAENFGDIPLFDVNLMMMEWNMNFTELAVRARDIVQYPPFADKHDFGYYMVTERKWFGDISPFALEYFDFTAFGHDFTSTGGFVFARNGTYQLP